MILHDWSDEECVKILSNIYRQVHNVGTVFIAEHMVPDPEKPHFSKLFDIHMMCASSGRERTAEEYAGLLNKAGWRYSKTLHSHSGLMGIVEGNK
jgi:hypothetical protein